MNTIKKTESTSALARHFLRKPHSPQPHRLSNERETVRKNLDALLPGIEPTRKNVPTPADQKTGRIFVSTSHQRHKVDLDHWIAMSMIALLAVGMVGLVAYILRDAAATTFWGGVGFTALLLFSVVMVSLWGGSRPTSNDPLRTSPSDMDEEERDWPLFRYDPHIAAIDNGLPEIIET